MVPGKSQTQKIARPSFDSTETPSVPGPLLCQTNPPPNPVCTGKPCLPNQNPSPIRFRTGDHGLAEPNRNHRLAPHNSARQTGAKARAGCPSDQTAPGQSQDTHRGKHPPQLRRQTGAMANAGRSLDQAAPRHAQGAHQTKRCQNNRRTPTMANTSHNSARQTGAGANARLSPDQAAPRYTNRNRQPQWRPAISVAEIRNY